MLKYSVALTLLSIHLFLSANTVEAITRDRDYYEKTNHVIWDVKTDEKLIAITFDDGPHPVYTPQILEILAKYKAKATFFVTGNRSDRYPHLLKRIVKEGHEIGNHTYNHLPGRRLSSISLKNELDQTAKTINRITGITPVLFRPVGGYYSDMIINTAIENNYVVIMWSWHQDPMDWKKPSANKIAEHIISAAKPGDIVLLHDSGGDRTHTVKALESILDYLTEHHYKCVTVSEMIALSEKLPQFP